MRYYNYFEVTDAARAFTGDFDLTALIDVLFEEVPTHPEHDTLFIEREYTDEEVQACDVTNWVSAYVPTDSGETMLAERWFTSPEHGPVHVGAWEDGSDAVSLSLATVEQGGLSPWNGGCRFIADTLKPETLGVFDRAYGSRAEWESDLATVEALLTSTSPYQWRQSPVRSWDGERCANSAHTNTLKG